MILLLSFLSPGRLLILLIIQLLILAYIFASLRQNRRGMRFTNTSMLDVVVPKQSQWRRHLAVALSLLSLITLTAAFARPKTQIDMPRQRATVVMVIDASLSMQAKDVEPARRVGIDPQRRDARGRRADDAPPRRPNNAVNPHRRRATRCRDAGTELVVVPESHDHGVDPAGTVREVRARIG